MSDADIAQARSAGDYAAGKSLIEEYQAALGVDLCFQDFAWEIATLPGIYGPPRGCLLIARVNGVLAGCAAVRGLDNGDCEIKRLYVRPGYRREGVGRRLVETAVHFARELGYARMMLDTLPAMTEAQSLYRSLGFVEIDSYCVNPVEGVRYLALELGGDES
jgi:ribosomal protein S18 acetylase RimI-like enzyme